MQLIKLIDGTFINYYITATFTIVNNLCMIVNGIWIITYTTKAIDGC
jgi:hypothetical protein